MKNYLVDYSSFAARLVNANLATVPLDLSDRTVHVELYLLFL